jgi:hypothetical protein
MILIPVASVVLFLFLWRGDMLDRPYLVGSLVLVSLAVILIAPRFSPFWTVGIVVNASVVIFLAIKLKLSL